MGSNTLRDKIPKHRVLVADLDLVWVALNGLDRIAIVRHLLLSKLLIGHHLVMNVERVVVVAGPSIVQLKGLIDLLCSVVL